MKRLLSIVLLIAICVSLAACNDNSKITKDNVGSNEVYDSILGIGIRLGMKKEEVDELFGKPNIYNDNYLYIQETLWVTYKDGCIDSIYIPKDNKRWITKGGILSGKPESELIRLFGEAKSNSSNSYSYIFYGKNNLVDSYEKGDHMVVISIEDEKVGGFLISSINKK